MQVNEEKGYTHVDGGESSRPQTQAKTIVDFPFDLNNLFSMQYSFDQLKMAIEYLARQQGDHQVLINQLLEREPGTVKIIERTETVIKEPAAQTHSGNLSTAKMSPALTKASPTAENSAKMLQTDAIPHTNNDTQTQAATTANFGVGDGDIRPPKTPSDN